MTELPDPCEKCDENALCEEDKCVCKPGFSGDGETCEGNLYRTDDVAK